LYSKRSTASVISEIFSRKTAICSANSCLDLTAPFLAPEKHQLLLQQKNRLMSYQLIVGSELAVRFVHLPSMEECMLQPGGWQEAVAEEMLAMYHCYTA